MVRAWVALAAGNRAVEVRLFQQNDGNVAAAELDGEHQPARPAADDDDGAIAAFAFTEFPACMVLMLFGVILAIATI